MTESISLISGPLRMALPWLLIATGALSISIGLRLIVARGLSPTASGPAVHQIRVGHSSSAAPSLVPPIADGAVPRDPALLPGAVRAYRAGRHEGTDFPCPPGTPVLAAADGWVLTIDDEADLPRSRRAEVLEYCRRLGRTPPEILHVLHGRRVVLCHGLRDGKLWTTSYSHLQGVREGLRPGGSVNQGDEIGTAGASGTSHASRPDAWAEVHFEIRIDGEPVGLSNPADAADRIRSLLVGREAR